jgi:hypothetical protein
MNTIPIPPADADNAAEISNATAATTNDARLTALALGEITDDEEARAAHAAIAADPELQREFAQTLAVSALLKAAFAKETDAHRATAADNAATPLPKPAPEAPARRRHTGGFGIAVTRRSDDFPKNNILRFVFGGASALGAAALLFLALRIYEPVVAPPQSTETLAAAVKKEEALLPGSIRMRPQAEGERRVAARTLRPGNIHLAPTATSPGVATLGTLVSRLPARVRNGGENEFIPVENPSREIALCLASTGRDYARRLHDSIALGRLPARELLRVDGLVNAFAAAPDSAAVPGIELVTEAVSAPWAPGHWLVRTTVQAGGMDVSIVATQAHATATFSPAQAASWRLLGCEAGGENAPALSLPAVIRSGEVLTTLFELVPASGAKAGESLGELKIAFTDATGKPVALSCKVAWPASGGIETATDETRVAAAAAALGLVLRQSPHRGGASVALAGRIAGSAHNPDRALFDSLLRDSAALERN